MRKKIATITFHASHNYGSMLQAYALQQTLHRLGYENDIINLRTDRQKKIYSRISYTEAFCGVKKFVKISLMMPYIASLKRKYDLFEIFLSSYLRLTNEYNTLEDLERANLSYDCYISGGDQIWNTSPHDFDWSFYLPFVDNGKKISYAVSMGPRAEENVTDRDRIKKYLSGYTHISVREEGTASLVSDLVNIPVSMDLDPTLLLTAGEWEAKLSMKPLVNGDYILLYAPCYKKSVYEMAHYLSRKLKMPVVVTMFTYHTWFFPFKRYLEVGPLEFLNLTRNARLVVSGSFHALIFSTLFHVPFFAVDGNRDNRMVTFLKNMDLQDRTISNLDREIKWRQSLICNFDRADQYIAENREKSLAHLIEIVES